MADFPKITLTSLGANLLAAAMNGETLTFTKAQYGSGAPPGSDWTSIIELVQLQGDLIIDSTTRSGQFVTLNVTMSNVNIHVPFWFREIGVWAKTDTLPEALFGYTNAGDFADFVPAEGGASPFARQMPLRMWISNAANVSVIIGDLAYVTFPDMWEHNLDPLAHPPIRQTIDDHINNPVPHVSPTNRTDWDGAKSDIDIHIPDNVRHFNPGEREAWNQNITDLATHDADNVRHTNNTERTAWNQNITNFNTHNADQVRHITGAERKSWNRGTKRLIATFTSSGTFTIANYTKADGTPLAIGDEIDVYVVAGGQAGGAFVTPSGGGGGNGGQCKLGENIVLSAASSSIVVGAVGGNSSAFGVSCAGGAGSGGGGSGGGTGGICGSNGSPGGWLGSGGAPQGKTGSGSDGFCYINPYNGTLYGCGGGGGYTRLYGISTNQAADVYTTTGGSFGSQYGRGGSGNGAAPAGPGIVLVYA